MSLCQTTLRRSSVQGAVAAVALMTASVTASALPAFTFDAGAAGLSGSTISADNILISDYSTVTIDGSGNFTQSGYLPVTGFQLGDTTFTPTGLNSTYGLYIQFSGTGTILPVGGGISSGSFSTLTYTLYGYNGSAAFGFSGNTPTESASGEVALASGTLISGTATSVPAGGGKFSPSANAELTVSVLTPSFFTAPSPFYSMALTSFSNTPSQVETFAGGFRIRQGGGSLNFEAAPVPEPSSIALLLSGLGVAGLLYRRKMGAQQR